MPPKAPPPVGGGAKKQARPRDKKTRPKQHSETKAPKGTGGAPPGGVKRALPGKKTEMSSRTKPHDNAPKEMPDWYKERCDLDDGLVMARGTRLWEYIDYTRLELHLQADGTDHVVRTAHFEVLQHTSSADECRLGVMRRLLEGARKSFAHLTSSEARKKALDVCERLTEHHLMDIAKLWVDDGRGGEFQTKGLTRFNNRNILEWEGERKIHDEHDAYVCELMLQYKSIRIPAVVRADMRDRYLYGENVVQPTKYCFVTRSRGDLLQGEFPNALSYFYCRDQGAWFLDQLENHKHEAWIVSNINLGVWADRAKNGDFKIMIYLNTAPMFPGEGIVPNEAAARHSKSLN